MTRPAKAGRERVQDEVREHLVGVGRQRRVGMHLVPGVEQRSDTEEHGGDRDVGQAGADHGAHAASAVRRSQHALHHVVVGAEDSGIADGAANEGGPHGELERGIRTPVEKLQLVRPGDGQRAREPAGDAVKEHADGRERAAEHHDDLQHLGRLTALMPPATV